MSEPVMAFDPGKTTGWAWKNGKQEECGELTTGTSADYVRLWDLLDRYVPQHVYFERFVAGTHYADTRALEVIGVIKLWCMRRWVSCEEVSPPTKESRDQSFGRHAAVAKAILESKTRKVRYSSSGGHGH